ncbi:MAG: GNAT family N-acetyltransferase [Bacteroidota bacterium]
MTPFTLSFQIEDFKPEHKPRWKEINEAWVSKDFYMEEIDHLHCSHPEQSILAGGGQILVATVDGLVVGTVGLLKEENNVFEVIKMAVDTEYRGHGIGKALCMAAIEKARTLNANRLYLYSNTKAVPAINLYRKLGFKETPLGPQEFERADIRMEIQIGT